MKTILLLIIFLFSFVFSFAQDNSKALTDALAQSKTLEKPLLLVIDTKLVDLLSKMNSNEFVDGQNFIKKINENFVLFEGSKESAFIKNILKVYYINSPQLIFMHANGEVFFVDCGCYDTMNKYYNMLDKAVTLSKNMLEYSLKNQYTKNYSKEKLEKLITARRVAGLTDNSALIEMYVNYVGSKDSLNYQTVKFILLAGPVIIRKAHSLIKDSRFIAAVYQNEPREFGSFVNKIMIENTLQFAIKNSCLPDALNAAKYYKAISRNDTINGQKYHDLQLLTYFLKTGDTAQYLSNAYSYYTKHFMYAKLIDSIKYLEHKNANHTPVSTNANSIAKINKIVEGHLNKEFSSVVHSKNANYYSNELNSAALSFVTTTTNKIHLKTALLWSRRSIDLKPSADNFNTLAITLYRLGALDEAIATIGKSIAIAKALNNPFENYSENLNKMKLKIL